MTLRACLAGDSFQVLAHLRPRLLAGTNGLDVHVVHRHAPLEQHREQQVVERLPQIGRAAIADWDRCA